MKTTKKYLIALPSFPNDKGFNHRTILITADSEGEAIRIAQGLRPRDNIGDVKEVYYYS